MSKDQSRGNRLRSRAALAGIAAGIALVAYLAGSWAADDQDSREGGLPEGLVPSLEDYVDSAMSGAGVPAVAIGIVAGDELVYSRGFGTGAQGQQVDAETMFEIGSATKPFLGATLALLAEREELDWDDRVSEHYSGFEFEDPWVTREFRIADLLAQRTGLAPYAADVLSLLGYGPSASIAAFAEIPAETSFRSEFAYQNVPHQVASRIVAEKTGARDWNEAVAELLLDPLGMTSSGTSSRLLTDSRNSTRGHQVDEGGLREVVPVSLPEQVYGAGSIVSNVRDMSRWIRFQLNRGELNGERILAPEQHAITWRPRVAVDGEFAERMEQVPGATQLSYATGWLVHSVPEGRVVEHGGTTLGYTSAVRLDPDREVGIVVLTNQAHAGGIAIPIAKYAFDLLQGREPHDPLAEAPAGAPAGPPETEIDSADAASLSAELAGAYRHPAGGRIELADRGGTLRAEFGPKRILADFEPLDRDNLILSWHVDNKKRGPVMSAPVQVHRKRGQVEALQVADLPFKRV